MNARIKKNLVSCINTMRQCPTMNHVIWLESNTNYEDPVFLSVYRHSPNNYTIFCDSPNPEDCFRHEEVPLRMVVDAIQTWFDTIEDVDKYKHFKY